MYTTPIDPYSCFSGPGKGLGSVTERPLIPLARLLDMIPRIDFRKMTEHRWCTDVTIAACVPVLSTQRINSGVGLLMSSQAATRSDTI